MRIILFLLFFGVMVSQATITFSQETKLSVVLKSTSIKDVCKEIEKNSTYNFVFSGNANKLINKKVDIVANSQDISQILDAVFSGMVLTYHILDNQIVVYEDTEKNISVAPSAELAEGTAVQQQPPMLTVSGTVSDRDGDLLPGVNIYLKSNRSIGTTTDLDGRFMIALPSRNDVLVFAFIGMKNTEIAVSPEMEKTLKIVLHPDDVELGEVVVTGIIDKKAESFTGAVSTVTSKDLLRVGNKNVIESLKNIDPSIYIMDNLTQGSNPNVLPDMEMRGTTSFPADAGEIGVTLKGNYGNIPNMPLFVLDGFETSIERIVDMDMYRVESITVLKDASAKALYGSKAANGVVVIETKKLLGNQQRITYTGSLDMEMPDLTSYNLANAAQKLEIERIEGVYTSNFVEEQLRLNALYNSRKKLIEEGLDTYWLAKPLRTGVGTKHNVNVELGDSRSVKAIADFTFNQINGVMKGSYRKNVSGNINLSYRYRKLLFRNIMSIVNNKSEESPWGTFSDYAMMNPYWRSHDAETGLLRRWAETESFTPNPMYDATIGTLNSSSYLDFTNNLYVEFRPTDYLRVTGRVGVAAKRSGADEFLPANHSVFSSTEYLYNEVMKMRRGSYRLDNGESSNFSGDLNAAYTRTFDEHFISGNVGTFVSESSYSAYVNRAEGFPNNQAADITFAKQYAEGTRPVGLSSLNREISFLSTANYSYANRYLIDLTYRISASSLYGRDNRWAPGWSVGLGWNLHYENFMKDLSFVEQLKLRTSVGVTGNQNFNTSYAVGTYQYYTDYNYNGFAGAYLSNLPNPQLRWEQKKEYNVGLDVKMGPVQLMADYYDSDTENMVTNVSVSPSTGFNMVKDNLGLVNNRGFEINANVLVFQNKDGFVNLYGSIANNSNKIIKLSESMRTYNELQEKEAANKGNNKPVLMYKDGMSMTAIWAVRSLGIDPMNGQEIYLKRDGTRTYDYDPLDLQVMGDTKPKARGHFGFTTEYKGFGFSSTFRYLYGGDMYNQTLVDRVENIDIKYNVDNRVILGRWQTPGQLAPFKRLGTYQNVGDPTSRQAKTQATSRFVQKRNELTWGSASLYYELPVALINSWSMERLRFSLYMNDIFTLSSIKVERGLSYPFARTVSCAVTATF